MSEINHFGGIQIRVVSGSGILVTTLFNADKSKSFTPAFITMDATSGAQEQFKLANFSSQKCIMRVEINNKNEYLEISKLILYFKTLWNAIPQ